MRLRRILVIVIAVIIVVPVGAGALLVATFDPNSYKPELIKAAERASGRQVTISGDLHLGLALTPTISASGITIDNPPGYPDAVMATLERVRAQVALLPLLAHRLDILNLTLVRPQITLERNAAGRGNWVFGGQGGQAAGGTPGAPSSATSTSTGTGTGTSTASPPAPRRLPQIALKSVSIEHAAITYKGVQQAGGPPAITTVSIPRLTGHADTLASPIAIHADASYGGVKVTVKGTTGPFARFTGGGGGQPWPVDLLAEAKGAKLAVQGTIADPRAMRGADVAMRADIPDLSALDPFAGGASLPPLKDVTLTAKVAEPQQGGLPAITDVKLDAGSADLGHWRKGLDLAALTVSMSSLETPVRLNIAGHYQGGPLNFSGTVGPVRPVLAALTGEPAAMAPPDQGDAGAGGKGGSQHAKPGKGGQAQAAPQKIDVNLTGHVAGGTVSISGAVATPATLSGVALKFDAQMPDVGKLSDLAGMQLPAITNLGLSFMLTDPGGHGLRHAVGVSSLAATADQFQIGGAGQFTFGTVPDLQAVVRAPRVNLTALEKAMPAPAKRAGGAAGGAAQPAQTTQQQGQAASGSGSQRLIPATAIPFGLLQRLDANVELTISQLVYGGQNYNAIVAHALLKKGRLTVRPISAQLPGGQVSGTLTANAAASPPSLHVTESAPSFHLGSLLSLLGHPGAGSGRVQVFADLSGAGNTPREIAGTLDGKLGVAMVNGEIDGGLLHQVLGGAVGAAGLPASVIGAQGPVSVPCFATRFDAKGGIATLRALTLDSSRLFLTGTGRVDLGAERVDLVLRPRVALGGGQSAPVPVAIRGSLANPEAGPASPQDYAETAGAIARQFGGQHAQGLLGEFAQKLGLSRPPPGPQSCSGALALARMGHGGPQPSASAMRGTPAPSAPGNQGGGGSGPQNLLNSLFH